MKCRGALLLLSLVLFISGQGCDENTCDYETKVLTEVPSPNGKLKAVIFKIMLQEGPSSKGNCPSEGPDYESLSILSNDEKVPEDTKKGKPRLGNVLARNSNLRVRWVSDNELLVTGHLHDSPDRPQTVGGVTVKYERDAGH